MKLRHHLLVSMMAAGGAFAVVRVLGGSDALAFGIAGFVFVLYWLTVLGGDVDLSDFLP